MKARFSISYRIVNAGQVEADIRLDLPSDETKQIVLPLRSGGVSVFHESLNEWWGNHSPDGTRHRTLTVKSNSWRELESAVRAEIEGAVCSLRQVAADYRELEKAKPSNRIEEYDI